MSYIRTKDGRIVDTTKIVTGSKFMDFATNDESFRVIFKTEPLATADTIEELCDEFILEEKMREVIYHHKSTKFDDFKTIAMLNERYTLYGAIWTEKGLIYVAKMNESGCLELI